MEDKKATYKTIDEYIAACPPDVRERLEKLREVVKEAAPGAKEKISYQMPAFDFNGTLVYFAAFKKHIGFYPTPAGIEEFRQELSEYKGSKGAIQFPLDKPLPYDLIRRIVEFRMAGNSKK